MRASETGVSATDIKVSDSPEGPWPSPARAWYAVFVLVLALTVSFVDRQILSLMVQPVRGDLALSDTQLSLLHGLAFAIFYTVLGIPLGRWADRRNRQRMVVAGMVVWCLATTACGLATSFGELFIARVFVGVGEAVLSPAAYSLISDYFPRERRARAMSVYSIGIFVGSGMALVLGGLAVQAAKEAGSMSLPLFGTVRSWQGAFIVVGLPGLLVAALMLTVREPSRRERQIDAQSTGTFAFVRAHAALIALIACGFAFGGGTIAFGFGAWLPTMFVRLHGWQPGSIAYAMGTIALTAGVAGVLAGGALGDWLARIRGPVGFIDVAIWGVLGMLPAAPFIGLSHSPWLALAGFAWLNLCLGLPTALAIPALHTITPNEHRGQVTAIYLFAANLIGLALGPMLIALATDKLFASDLAIGKSLALVTTISAASGLILLLVLRRKYRLHTVPTLQETTR